MSKTNIRENGYPLTCCQQVIEDGDECTPTQYCCKRATRWWACSFPKKTVIYATCEEHQNLHPLTYKWKEISLEEAKVSIVIYEAELYFDIENWDIK